MIVEHRRRHPPDPIRIGGLALDASNSGSRLGRRLLRTYKRQNRRGQLQIDLGAPCVSPPFLTFVDIFLNLKQICSSRADSERFCRVESGAPTHPVCVE